MPKGIDTTEDRQVKMEENKQEQRKIQQNLLNYVSHNLTNKKDKPKEKERSDSKSSTGRET